MLLNAGADRRLVDVQGNTPLHTASAITCPPSIASAAAAISAYAGTVLAPENEQSNVLLSAANSKSSVMRDLVALVAPAKHPQQKKPNHKNLFGSVLNSAQEQALASSVAAATIVREAHPISRPMLRDFEGQGTAAPVGVLPPIRTDTSETQQIVQDLLTVSTCALKTEKPTWDRDDGPYIRYGDVFRPNITSSCVPLEMTALPAIKQLLMIHVYALLSAEFSLL